MTMRPSVRDAMLAAVPSLRAFAISLCGNVDRADDLVQETLLRAMANIDSFQPGTNMSAWLFTILRNLFRSEYRKRRREVEDADGSYAESLKSHPEQHSRVEFQEFREALGKLPPDQREALILVGASGFSYEEAASICECAVGTIKSRVNRARTRLAELLSIDGAADFGPDDTTPALLSAGGAGGAWRPQRSAAASPGRRLPASTSLAPGAVGRRIPRAYWQPGGNRRLRSALAHRGFARSPAPRGRSRRRLPAASVRERTVRTRRRPAFQECLLRRWSGRRAVSASAAPT